MTGFLRVRRLLALPVFPALGVLFVLGTPIGASQQQPPSEPVAQELVAPDYSGQIPAHVSAVTGTVTLEREGKITAVEENIILLAGDRLRTTQGRMEILYTDGSSIAVDENTTFDLLDDALMRLLGGRVKLAITRATGSLEYRVDTVAGAAMIRTPGEYRISLLDQRGQPEVELTVVRGSAELVNDHGKTAVRAGTYAVANADQAPSLPYVANSAAWSDFDRWASEQRNARVSAYSTQYLPTEVHYYAGAFDRHGDWSYEAPYGYVWYPRVAVGWRPYHYGKWSYHFQFGWFWVGSGPWAWPTHHYGRWGVSHGRWHWIPHHAWGPAWVSWAYSPGYVSWCPLGFYNRPLYPIHSINHLQAGWTVLPSRHFVPNVAVPRHVAAQVPTSAWSDFRPPRPNLREDPAPIRSVRGSPGSAAMPRANANRLASTAAPMPSGSRSSTGSRLAPPTPSASRAIPRDRPGTPIESPEPARLRGSPDAGGFAERISPPARTVPGQRVTSPGDPAAAPAPGTAIRRSQPVPAGSLSTGSGWPSRQASPPDRGPAPTVRTPDSGSGPPPAASGPPSGSRRSSGSMPSPSPTRSSSGTSSSSPSRSAPATAQPRGGSAPQQSAPPPRASGGSSSRSAPPASTGSGSRSSSGRGGVNR